MAQRGFSARSGWSRRARIGSLSGLRCGSPVCLQGSRVDISSATPLAGLRDRRSDAVPRLRLPGSVRSRFDQSRTQAGPSPSSAALGGYCGGPDQNHGFGVDTLQSPATRFLNRDLCSSPGVPRVSLRRLKRRQRRLRLHGPWTGQGRGLFRSGLAHQLDPVRSRGRLIARSLFDQMLHQKEKPETDRRRPGERCRRTRASRQCTPQGEGQAVGPLFEGFIENNPAPHAEWVGFVEVIQLEVDRCHHSQRFCWAGFRSCSSWRSAFRARCR